MKQTDLDQFATIEEIIEYAISEEEEAYRFYINMALEMQDPEMITFLHQLAEMEKEHADILRQKLEDCKVHHYCSEGIMASFHEPI